ncbi:hypothetical protein B484DRAFT_481533 [Ochromonadaceae sp. CCMP2298]|nr:hypothetical protein B484DRAFT_481533 [Ochromonadaceae sp. CCMP2298]
MPPLPGNQRTIIHVGRSLSINQPHVMQQSQDPRKVRPWIRQYIMNLISEQSPADYSTQAPRGKLPHQLLRYVQILSYNEETRSIVVSDSELYIHAFLSRECFDELVSQHSISSLKFSQLALQEWCLSTVAQAAGNRTKEQLQSLHVFFPIALHCFKVSFLRAGKAQMGRPGAMGGCAEVVEACRGLAHGELKRRLALKQFPVPQSLPDYEGCFDEPYTEAYSASTPEGLMRWALQPMPQDQTRIIDALGTRHHSGIVKALPQLLLEEYGNRQDAKELVAPDGADGADGQRRSRRFQQNKTLWLSSSSGGSDGEFAEGNWVDEGGENEGGEDEGQGEGRSHGSGQGQTAQSRKVRLAHMMRVYQQLSQRHSDAGNTAGAPAPATAPAPAPATPHNGSSSSSSAPPAQEPGFDLRGSFPSADEQTRLLRWYSDTYGATAAAPAPTSAVGGDAFAGTIVSAESDLFPPPLPPADSRSSSSAGAGAGSVAVSGVGAGSGVGLGAGAGSGARSRNGGVGDGASSSSSAATHSEQWSMRALSPSGANKRKHAADAVGADPLLHRRVRRKFPTGYFDGEVTTYDSPFYGVVYEDGDTQEMDRKEVLRHLIPEAIAVPEGGEKDEDEVLTQPQMSPAMTRGRGKGVRTLASTLKAPAKKAPAPAPALSPSRPRQRMTSAAAMLYATESPVAQNGRDRGSSRALSQPHPRLSSHSQPAVTPSGSMHTDMNALLSIQVQRHQPQPVGRVQAYAPPAPYSSWFRRAPAAPTLAAHAAHATHAHAHVRFATPLAPSARRELEAAPLQFAFLSDDEIMRRFPGPQEAIAPIRKRTTELHMAFDREKRGIHVAGLEEYKKRSKKR